MKRVIKVVKVVDTDGGVSYHSNPDAALADVSKEKRTIDFAEKVKVAVEITTDLLLEHGTVIGEMEDK